MPKVKLTITESKCRCGYFKKGQEFIVEKIYVHLYAMNFGITYILRSMRYRMELHLIMVKVMQKYLMLNVQTRVEFVFMERL